MNLSEKEILAKKIGNQLFNGNLRNIESYIQSKRWFRRKSEIIKKVILKDYTILGVDPIEILSILEIYYENYSSEIYYLPLIATFDNVNLSDEEKIMELEIDNAKIILFDAFSEIKFCADLLKLINKKKQIKSLKGVFSFYPTEVLNKYDKIPHNDQIKLISSEQSNTSINYYDSFIMKNFRNIEYGINPDFEITYFLTKQRKLKNVPALLGYIEYQNENKLTATAAVLQEYITNQGDCWNYTLLQLEDVYRIAMRHISINNDIEITNIIKQFSTEYIKEIKRLGEITGLFHKALTTDLDDDAFKAEYISCEDVELWLSTMKSSMVKIFSKIEDNLNNYSIDVQKKIDIVLKNKSLYTKILDDLSVLKEYKQKKIRIHGDYHLGQILKTEKDFVILDFEGEPIKTMEERRAKLLPEKDIAGMLRSINYAACMSLSEIYGLDDFMQDKLNHWSYLWQQIVSQSFLDGYYAVMKDELPDKTLFERILTVFQLDKAIYELDYEINNRPDWLKIPVEYLNSLVK